MHLIVPRQRLSVDEKHFIRFRYRISVDGEHFMRFEIDPGLVWAGPHAFLSIF